MNDPSPEASPSEPANVVAARLEQNLPRLRAFLRVHAGRELRTRESLDDLAQTVCREVIADAKSYVDQGEPAFRKWLFLTAERKLLDRHRHHHRKKRDVSRERRVVIDSIEDHDSLVDAFASWRTPSRILAAREELDRLADALDELPDDQRRAIALVKIVGLPYEDVAQSFGRSPSAVRGLVLRGLAQLSTKLSRDGAESENS